jgi:hypothetical protein
VKVWMPCFMACMIHPCSLINSDGSLFSYHQYIYLLLINSDGPSFSCQQYLSGTSSDPNIFICSSFCFRKEVRFIDFSAGTFLSTWTSDDSLPDAGARLGLFFSTF